MIPTSEISIDYFLARGGMRIRIFYRGLPPEISDEEVNISRMIKKKKKGGLGVKLMKTIMDSVTYTTRGRRELLRNDQMAENEVKRLQKELKFKKLQLNSIYELSSAMQSQFDVDHVMRIFFSSLMAPLGISRTFFFDRDQDLFRKRGFVLSDGEALLLKKKLAKAMAGLARWSWPTCRRTWTT